MKNYPVCNEFNDLFAVPVASPKIQDAENINSTAAILYWIPVQDDRESMKGRVRGYTVSREPGGRLFETHHEKTCPWGYRPDPTKTGLFGQRRWLEACDVWFKKKRDLLSM